MNVSDRGIHTRCGMNVKLEGGSRDGVSITRGSFLPSEQNGGLCHGQSGYGEVATWTSSLTLVHDATSNPRIPFSSVALSHLHSHSTPDSTIHPPTPFNPLTPNKINTNTPNHLLSVSLFSIPYGLSTSLSPIRKVIACRVRSGRSFVDSRICCIALFTRVSRHSLLALRPLQKSAQDTSPRFNLQNFFESPRNTLREGLVYRL